MLFNLFNKNKKYGHVISLGYNCEVAFQFLKNYKFVEASLFTWANTININNLIYALNNYDKLMTGEVRNVKPLYKCFNTNIRFHGREPMEIWLSDKEPDEEIKRKDKEELLSRIAHLKEKFLNTAKDGKKNLYIFSYLVKNESIDEIKTNITHLYDSLCNIVKNEFDLLIVFENNKIPKDLELNLNNKNIYIRTVKFFAPEDKVTGDYCDNAGWKKIYSEFRPNFKLKIKKRFKFEKD